MSVRTSVYPSTQSFFNFSEIWCVGRGRRVVDNGMQYDLIQDPKLRSQALESWKFGHFQRLSTPHL